MRSFHGRLRPSAVTLSAAPLILSACAKAEDSAAAPAAGAAQVAQSAAPGAATCTIDQYGGTRIDLKTAKVGFSQSEKEATPCKHYLTFIGSDFAEQGKRAADEMAEALGNKGTVAILLGAPGNNVTTLRTSGFKDQLARIAPSIKIVFEQTGNFAREEGQKVTGQLPQSNPDINGIYGIYGIYGENDENDEMALGAITALKGADNAKADLASAY